MQNRARPHQEGQRIPSLGCPHLLCLCHTSGKEVSIKCEFPNANENSGISTAQPFSPSLDAMDQRLVHSIGFGPQIPAQILTLVTTFPKPRGVTYDKNSVPKDRLKTMNKFFIHEVEKAHTHT